MTTLSSAVLCFLYIPNLFFAVRDEAERQPSPPVRIIPSKNPTNQTGRKIMFPPSKNPANQGHPPLYYNSTRRAPSSRLQEKKAARKKHREVRPKRPRSPPRVHPDLLPLKYLPGTNTPLPGFLSEEEVIQLANREVKSVAWHNEQIREELQKEKEEMESRPLLLCRRLRRR